MKKEYKVLPQSERDQEGFIKNASRPSSSSGSGRSCCLILLISLTFLLIISGLAALTIGLFFSQQFTTFLNENWPGNLHSFTEDFSNSNVTSPVTSSTTEYVTGNSSNVTNATENGEMGNSTFSTEGEDLSSTEPSDSDKEKFAEAMRTIEKYLENLTGIKRAEFVIPLFMLLCFVVFFSIVTLCCYCMMKRRESRRRKILGKIITDLQTGDSKSVLLNDDDEE